MHFDNATVERLRQLDEAKKQAVARGDFEKAIEIRDAIKGLQEVGRKLNLMVTRKRAHMENQEYYQAEKIKTQIDETRHNIHQQNIFDKVYGDSMKV